MSEIFVSPLSALEQTLRISGAQNLITLMGPGKTLPRPNNITGHYLALEFHDISSQRPGYVAPSHEQISQLIDYFNEWNGDGGLAIHCWMGISRSTAAAAIACATLSPDMTMDKLAQNLRNASPMATPNPLMISLADQILGLDGRFVKAIASIGRGAEASEGAPFSLTIGEQA